MASIRHYLLLYAKGLAMGAADVVPGVSGGTIAFISGIYDELVDSLKSLNPLSLRILLREGPSGFWRSINGNFLVVLFAGIFTSVFTLANGVHYLLEHQPLLVWSFFFGLIAASIIYILRQFHIGKPLPLLCLGAGILGGLACAFAPPGQVSATPLIIFLAGMLAVCAMILPGISGSFILLLIGLYPVIIEAITTFQLTVLVIFATGAAIGLVAFSNLLSWLLHHHRSATLALLTGFLVGSLTVVWPWKVGPEGETGRVLLSPDGYRCLVGDPRVAENILLMVAGLTLVLGLEYMGARVTRRKRLL